MKRYIIVLIFLVPGFVFGIPQAAAANELRQIDAVNYIPGADRLVSRSIRHWNWNPTTRINLVDSCRPNVQCVHIHLREPSLGRVGEASPWEGYIRISPKFWKWNSLFPSGWIYRQALICHELGHILGLDHTSDGCMQDGRLDRRFPGAYNRSIVPGELLNYWVS